MRKTLFIFFILSVTQFGLGISPLPEEQMPFVSAWDKNWTEMHVDEIRAAANEGIVEAQLTLASLYDMGNFFSNTPGIESIEKDESEALNWYAKAAENGSWKAMNNLAVIYYHGRGVEVDQAKAKEYLLRAWNLEDDDAIAANLAFYYMNIEISGKKHPNYIEASKWYRISASLGNWYSQYEYGKFCETGLGALKDNTEALKWFYLSSAKGHSIATQAATELENKMDKADIRSALNAAKEFLEKKGAEQDVSGQRR